MPYGNDEKAQTAGTSGAEREESNTARDARIRELAACVLENARTKLLLHLRFLDRALCELKLEESAKGRISTDGKNLYYDPEYVLVRYREEQEFTCRVWLHVLMHCLFFHMETGEKTDSRMWDLAADIFSENLTASLYPEGMTHPVRMYRQQEIRRLKEKLRMDSAETVYRDLTEDPPDPQLYAELKELVSLDDHGIWRERPASGDGTAAGGRRTREKYAETAAAEENSRSDAAGGPEGSAAVWKRIAGEMQEELLARSREMGDRSADFMRSLGVLTRRRTDYRDFLRKFAVRSEVLHTSPEEFDYIFYNYGLELYRDTPLIEPLEYREDRKIRDFVIVIDTSGSVSGKPVKRFLEETWQVLKTREAFAERFQLHILQCDAFVKRDDVIVNQREFDRFMEELTLRGFGGTDFRPAFVYVEELRREHKIRDLKGMLYFTDGLGIFPEKPPDYLTAFLISDTESYSLAGIPAWAITAVMDREKLAVYERR